MRERMAALTGQGEGAYAASYGSTDRQYGGSTGQPTRSATRPWRARKRCEPARDHQGVLGGGT